MAKRNKVKFASKSRKSALRVEALEQRQLLAAVTGGGTEVGSNIAHPNGNVYDQVLMTGSSVTVSADPGQVTRVSFLDLQGDIVQAEFAGKGTLTISLDQFKAAAEAANYNQPGVNYVGGHASFIVQGGDATTNFSVFSVGSGNAVNQSLFEGGKTGGNNTADIARLLIVADPTNPGGFSTMGGIRAGNAVFSDTSGAVGISAANVNVQGPVIVGDINAANAGVPTLNFAANSQFATLTVAGGDFVQDNGANFTVGGFQTVNSVDGSNSAGTTLRSNVIANAPLGLAANQVVTIDSITSFDLTGKTQAEIDSAFKGRTFQSAVTVSGDLTGINNIMAAEFRSGLTFTGTLTGDVTVDGAIKSLTLAKANTNTIKAASIGDLTTTGNLGGTIRANSIGNVTVGGDLTGTVSSDFNGNGIWNTGEKTVGNVNVTGNMTGAVQGVLGIGNVTIGGNLTTTGTALMTSSGTTGDSFLGNIGNVWVTGDISQGAGALINIAVNGTFGDITVEGKGTNTAAHTVGTITVAGSLGAAGTKAGNINITDNTASGVALTLGAINIAGNGSLGNISVTNTGGNVATGAINFTGTGSLGDVSVKGSGVKGSTAALGAVTLSTGTGGVSLGNISVTNAEAVTLGAVSAKTIGTVTGTAVDATGTVTVNTGALTANNGTTNATIGAITLNATSNGAVTVGGDITTNNVASGGSSSIGAISLTGKTIALNSNIQSSSVGDVSLTGNATFADTKGIQALKGLASFTAVGDTTFNTSTGPANIRVGGTTGANFTFTGTTTFTGGVAPAILADNGGAALDALGNLTFNGKVVGVAGKVDIRGSSIGDITVKAALGQTESLVTDLNVVATNNGIGAATTSTSTERVSRDGSNLASFAIGNISVSNTNVIGVASTALFNGANSFQALGKVGNVSLTAGGSAAVQTELFNSAGDGLFVQTGNGDVFGAANATKFNGSGIDFDGNNVIGNVTSVTSGVATNTDETTSLFSTNVTVQIGNITVNAAGAGNNALNNAGGGSAGGVDGLLVLSGAKTDGGADYNLTTGLAATDAAKVRGTVGNVHLTNLNQQLSRNPAGTAADTLDNSVTAGNGGLIVGVKGSGTTAPIGTVQLLAFTGNATLAQDNYVVGGSDSVAADGELTVVIL